VESHSTQSARWMGHPATSRNPREVAHPLVL